MKSTRFNNSAIEGALERERKPLIGLALFFAMALSTLYYDPAVLAQGLSSAGDYANRLERVKRAVDEVIEHEFSVRELVVRMNEIKVLAPAKEDVQFNGSILRVDNSWLHEAVKNVIDNAGVDIEERRAMLTEISERLDRLRQSVIASQTTEDKTSQDQRAQLDNILSRPEYQPDEKRESLIGRWSKRISDFILRQLGRMFSGSSAPREGGAGLMTVFRILVFLAVITALVIGALKLSQLLKRRKKAEIEAEPREALGEEIAEDVTAADLFANASEMARQGEYRKAIRRTYIALLCDLEERGKLRLGRSKTNRDYMDAVRSEQRIFPTFSSMTNAFEHVWYGQERATEDEFREFVTLYQDLVK